MSRVPQFEFSTTEEVVKRFSSLETFGFSQEDQEAINHHWPEQLKDLSPVQIYEAFRWMYGNFQTFAMPDQIRAIAVIAMTPTTFGIRSIDCH